jgi:hypothetical protein
MISLRKSIAVFLISTAPAAYGIVDSMPNYDVGVRSGYVGGVIHDPNREDDDQATADITFGAIPLQGILTTGLSREWSSSMIFGVLMDVVNSQVIEQGIEGDVSWHFMGGTRQIRKESEIALLEGRTRYDASLIGRASYQQFTISSKEDPDDIVKGSVVSLKIGAAARFDFVWDSAVAAELVTTLMSFPSSTERLGYQEFALGLIWRKQF